MARHSKWHNIKVRKGAQDKIRSKIFTLHSKLIALAAQRGGDITKNPALFEAIEKAKKANVPADNIERAVKKGSGIDKSEAQVEEVIYEGYGVMGVALVIRGLTDNRNRTAPNIRHIFSKYSGNLGETGSVSGYAFDYKGMITGVLNGMSIEDFEVNILESGAEDYELFGEEFRVITEPSRLMETTKFLQGLSVEVENFELGYLPKNVLEIDDFDKALKIYKLIDDLEQDEDVEKVWHTASIPDELVDKIETFIESNRFKT